MPSMPVWRELGAADVDAIYQLHVAATTLVGRPELIRPESRDFFSGIIGRAGKIIGVQDESLIGYGVLQWDLSFEEDPYGPLGLTMTTRLAKLAGTSVRPDAWGRGYHRQLIAWRVHEAKRLGFQVLYATSAPGNYRSWTNLMDEGFSVRAIREIYGGCLRYFMVRDVRERDRPLPEGIWCRAEDIGEQRRLIASGHEGLARRGTGSSHAILYVKCR